MEIRVLAIISALIYSIWIVRALHADRLGVRQSLLWLLSAVMFLLISTFPALLQYVGHVLGFVAPSNALFLVWLLVTTLILFYQSLLIAQHNNQIRTIAQELAMLRLSMESQLETGTQKDAVDT